jgi:hypothetical protein
VGKNNFVFEILFYFISMSGTIGVSKNETSGPRWKMDALKSGKRLLLGGRDVNDGCAAWWEKRYG